MKRAKEIVESLLDDESSDPKDFVKDARLVTDKFVVSGISGILQCDPVTGVVLELQDDGNDRDNYRNIARVDVNEYVEWLTKLEARFPGLRAQDSGTDIMFVGYWTKDGVHEPPCELAREQYEGELARDRGIE